MDKELLNKALAEMLNTFTEVKGFAIEQAPDVVQQLITYTIITNGFLTVVGIVIIALSFYFAIRYFNETGGGSAALGFVVSLLGFIAIVEGGSFWKAWLAPKVFLIEYTAKLAS